MTEKELYENFHHSRLLKEHFWLSMGGLQYRVDDIIDDRIWIDGGEGLPLGLHNVKDVIVEYELAPQICPYLGTFTLEEFTKLLGACNIRDYELHIVDYLYARYVVRSIEGDTITVTDTSSISTRDESDSEYTKSFKNLVNSDNTRVAIISK